MIQTLDLPLSALGSRHKGFQSVASDWTNGFQNLKLIEEIRENLLGASAGFDFEATLAIQSIASICSSKVSKMRGKSLFFRPTPYGSRQVVKHAGKPVAYVQIQWINAVATSSYRQSAPKEELNKDRYIIHWPFTVRGYRPPQNKQTKTTKQKKNKTHTTQTTQNKTQSKKIRSKSRHSAMGELPLTSTSRTGQLSVKQMTRWPLRMFAQVLKAVNARYVLIWFCMPTCLNVSFLETNRKQTTNLYKSVFDAFAEIAVLLLELFETV